MAITAAIRTNIIELNVLAGNGAPGTTGLGDLVATWNTSGMAGVSASITGAAGWKAKFPSFQTPEEFGKEFLEMIVPGLSEAGMTEGIAIIAGLLNSGSTQGDVLTASSNFLSDASVTDAAFGDYAAKFQNQAAVAEFHTVTQEKDTPLALTDITSDAATVVTAKGDIDGSTAAAAAAAAATAAAAAAAAATAAADAAAATAAAALVTAATDAAAAATTAIATATAADTALATAVAASTAADTKAALTDAAALATAATAAAAADTTAQATLTTANTAYTAAIAGGDAATVSLANGTKLIAAAAAATTAAASVAAAAASAAATADDAAAVTALAAEATALTASNTAKAAADTAAAAAATAAAATPDTADDTAATAQVASAAASSAAADEINAAGVSTAALATATTAVAAGATANAAATTAIAAVNSDATAAAASTAANAAVTAATAATTATAAATAAAAATGAAAADAASAATLAASAATQAAAATASVASATAASDSSLYPQALSLTTNTDNKTGGAGNDTFTGSGTTFNSDDILAGGAGTDTLLFTVAPTAGPVTVIANLSALETLKVTNGGTQTQTLNLIGATGVEGLENRLSGANVQFTNVQALATVTANGTTGGETTASFLNALVTGTADTATVNLTNNAVAHINIGGATATNEFDVINLSSTAATLNTLSAIEQTDSTALARKVAVNVTGDANLTITTLTAGAKSSINASAFTGVLKVTTTANIDTVTGGSGNDTITIGSALAGAVAADTFDGGAGNDTIVLGAGIALSDLVGAAGAVHSYTAETLNYKAPSANVDEAIDISAITGATTLEIDPFAGDNDADLDVTTVTNIVDETIVIDHATSANATSSTRGTSISLALKTATGTADSIDITLKNTITASELGVLTAASIETVNITSSGGKAYQIASPVFTSAKTLNILGAQDLLLGTEIVTNLAASSAAANSVINASALTGKLTIGSVAVPGVEASSITLTGGSAADKFYFGATLNNNAASTAGDVIDGGGGSDTLFVTDTAGGAVTQEAKSITNVETINLDTITGGDDTLSMKNVAATTALHITDAANAAGFGTTVTNLAGQEVIFKTSQTAGTDTNFNTANFSFGNAVNALGIATGTTAMTITLDDVLTALGVPDGAAYTGGTITTTGVTALTINDTNVVGASSLNLSQTVTVAGAAATASSTIGSVTLTGGGATNAAGTTIATLTLAGTSNVNLSTIDATALASNLDMDSVTTKAGASVLLGSGNNKVTIALADAARDAMTVNGGEGTDTVIIANLDGDSRPTLVGVEKLDLDTNGTSSTGTGTLALTDAAGIVAVDLALDTTDESFTISGASDLATIKLAGTATATSDVITLGSGATLTVNNEAAVGGTAGSSALAVVTGSATALTIEQTNSSELNAASWTAAKAVSITMGGTQATAAGAQYAGAMRIETLSAAKATTLTVDSNQGARTIDTLTAAKLTTLNIVGDNAVSIGAVGATTTVLATVAGGTATGAITIPAALDFAASGASISTGTNNDSISLDIVSEAGTAIAMGTKALDTDTLTFTGNNSQGLTVINLAAADQISQANGAVNAAVQTGIENVNLAGLTGTSGVSVTGTATINSITGSPQADVINTGAGNDTITIAAGTDGNSDIMNGGANTDTLVIAGGLTATIDNDGDIALVENITFAGAGVAVMTGQTEGFIVTAAVSTDVDNDFTGGSGNDTFTSTNTADTDELIHTAVSSTGGVDTYVTFTLGSGKDIINFPASATTATGYSEVTSAPTLDTSAVGVLILDFNVATAAAAMTAGALYTAASGGGNTSGNATEDVMVAVTTDATNAADVFVFRAVMNAGSNGFASIDHVVTLTGVTDLTASDTANWDVS